MDVGNKLRESWRELQQALTDCCDEPAEKAVHRLRTRCRRVEAIVSSIIEMHAAGREGKLADTGNEILRKLKKIRRGAGAVRDLDIHAMLLESISTGHAGGTIEKLKKKLQREREKAAVAVVKIIKKHRPKLEIRADRFFEVFNSLPATKHQLDTLALSTSKFLEASAAIPVLGAENLHEFRKRSKIARYVAEINPRSAASVRLAKKLNRIQDAIGMWHDWDVMRSEAEELIGNGHSGLLPQIDAKRKETYRKALEVARRTQRELLRAHPTVERSTPVTRRKGST